MIPKECKRLAEVDFPIAVVSAHAAREKSIRHGHPSTLHLWWARRPLASSRAVLMGLLLPDPCDPECPDDFKKAAKEILAEVRQAPTSDESLQKALLWFIGAFANWDMAANRTYLRVARDLVRAANPEETPLVVDPFAGGGSIPLEALRLGCETFASDLNPVACLILRVILEDIPRQAQRLPELLRLLGAAVNRRAQLELAEFYPQEPSGETPIAYLWARTVNCEAPHCGAEIPLVRSLWLSKKAHRKRALKIRVEKRSNGLPRIEFDITSPKTDKDVGGGTVTRAKATCPACGAVLQPERVRGQLSARRGGADVEFDVAGRRIGGARLLAVVSVRAADPGRHYRRPEERDYAAVHKAQTHLAKMLTEWKAEGRQGWCPVPDEPLPPIGTLGFRVQRYGMGTWGDLYTARQKVALSVLARLIGTDADKGAASRLVALALGKTADLSNSGAPWKPGAECPVHMLSSQKIPPFWDWAEPVPYIDASGSFTSAYDRSAAALEAAFSYSYSAGSVQQADAADYRILPDDSAAVWFTDPPYYDAVPYADLSDFFLVWLRRALPEDRGLQDPFDPTDSLSPKRREAVQDESKQDDGRPKDGVWFEEAMAQAFTEGRRVLRASGIGSVVFAHKTTEGWEALLAGMIRGGWTITGSWPIATEMGSRLRARESAALATSVHLVCRPRPHDAGIGDRAAVLQELPLRVGKWMDRLQDEGVRGADLVFACIGPALEVFSRYAKVETAEGGEVTLAEYLKKVWEVVGRSALAQVLGTDGDRGRHDGPGAIEEDARLTALFLWTLQSSSSDAEVAEDADGGGEEDDENDADEDGTPRGRVKGLTLVFDVVRRFAQPLGIGLPNWEGRVIETKKGVVRLLPVSERAEQLFGVEGAEAVAVRIESAATLGGGAPQLKLFPEPLRDSGSTPGGRERGRGRRQRPQNPDDNLTAGREATTLDRVHAAMLMQAAGRTNALRALLKAEQERGTEFLRLANALSALYPKTSEEKRLLDAMLLAVPR